MYPNKDRILAAAAATAAVLLLLVVGGLMDGVAAKQPCVPRQYDQDSVVCVCTEDLCDNLDVSYAQRWPAGKALEVESSAAGGRFVLSMVPFDEFRQDEDNADADEDLGRKPKIKTLTLTLDKETTYQEIIGFGGAFTDAAAMNILNLPRPLATRLVQDYFAQDGIEYSLGRVPIGGTDFSIRGYTLADDYYGQDFGLANFSLAEEDLNYKIPLIQMALNETRGRGRAGLAGTLRLFASPWSAPAWMKTNRDLIGRGTLSGGPGSPFWATWANYFLKFLQAYKAHGIDHWGLTVQNEPTDGLIPGFKFNCMGWHAAEYREFLRTTLGPTLDRAGYTRENFKIMIWDDDRNFMGKFVDEVMRNEAGYVAGFAAHWYANLVGPELFDKIHQKWPGRFILATEACAGWEPWDHQKVKLGDWGRAEAYAKDILADLQHWVAGWTDWNLALDSGGGPNWAKNYVDSPIIVNATAGEYLKQPMFYVLGHFAKFLPPGSVRVELEIGGQGRKDHVDGVSFVVPEQNATVLVLHNPDEKLSYDLEIRDRASGNLTTTIGPRTIKTIVWRQDQDDLGDPPAAPLAAWAADEEVEEVEEEEEEECFA